MTLPFFPGAPEEIALGVANHLWQSTVVALIAASLTLALRNNHARIRYWLWFAASLKFLIPFSLLVMLGTHLTWLHRASTSQAMDANAGAYLVMEQVGQPFTSASIPSTPAASASKTAPTPERYSESHAGALLPAMLAAVWLLGALLISARWARRWWRISAIAKAAPSLCEGREADALRRMTHLGRLRRRVGLKMLPVPVEPGIFGLFRPVLLWPEGISQRLDDAQLEAVVAHEVCHVRRGDNMTAALHMAVQAVFWFHPLVWWLETRLVKEREAACDEEVLQMCGQARAYAESILQVCEFCVESPLPCMSGVTGADLKKRVRQIVAGNMTLKLDLGRKLLLAATTLTTVAVPILFGQAKFAQSASHGPANGYLVITGGQPDFPRMIELAGGKAARIVVIPTAAIRTPEDEKMLPPYCSQIFAGMKCSVLHTTDRNVADSPGFVAPLKDATGVYLEGGRQWRLADAYLGTLTLKEIFGVLDRGGVVMGGSAGATIQGSYLVRGSSNPDDNTIMMAPGHEAGFGLITNAAIDQHVDMRERENDLAPVIEKHPGLLGIGLDQTTSITVHGDTLTCNGPRRAAIWDGKDHDGKGFYYLRAGDSLDLVTRVPAFVPHAPDPWDNPVKLPQAELQSYAGVYELGPNMNMVMTVEDGQLISQLGPQPKVPLFAKGEAQFVAKVVEAEIDFVKGADGKVTSLELRQNGRVTPMKRLDDAAAKRAMDEAAARAAIAAKRFEEQKPAQGSEAAVRKDIADIQAGTPAYDTMSPGLANATRQQLPAIQALFAQLGAAKTVKFTSVDRNGADIYRVEFEHGATEWRITLTPDGKVDMLGFHPVQ